MTRKDTSSTVPSTPGDVDQVADTVLVLDDDEDAREVVLHKTLRPETQRNAENTGAGQ